jgi:site-specific DNA-cytosine methylase
MPPDVRIARQQCLMVSAPETVPVSAAFGIPHRRRRFFLVASLYGDARDVLLSQARVRPPCA